VQIQQVEYRWVQARGFSPIADSWNGARHLTDLWEPRLRRFVRHPDPPGSGNPAAPDAGLVYLQFEDRQAAVVWRAWQPDALSLGNAGDHHERGGYVTRVLVGSAGTLRPEVGLAICRRGLPPEIGPQPGQVPRAAELEPIPSEAFETLVAAARSELDIGARTEPGLRLLVAGALRDPDRPISVVLPDELTAARPATGHQTPLLWGLWRCVGPLFGPYDRRPVLGWRWSYSTYEPPLGHEDAGLLPHVVFRSTQRRDGVQPVTFRTETVVRPRDPMDPHWEQDDGYARIGDCLASAYRELGANELTSVLTGIAAEHASLSERIAEIPHTKLGDYYSSGQSSAWSRNPLAARPADADAGVGVGRGADAGSGAGADGFTARSSEDYTGDPLGSEEKAKGARRAQFYASGDDGYGLDRSGSDTPTGIGETAGPDDLDPSPAESGDLVSCYRALPVVRGTPHFRGVVRAIRALTDDRRGRFVPSPLSRELRAEFAANRWYVQDLHWMNFAAVEEELAMLLNPIVVSDLRTPETLAELQAVAVDPKTPVEVLTAIMLLLPKVSSREALDLEREVMPAILGRLRRRPALPPPPPERERRMVPAPPPPEPVPRLVPEGPQPMVSVQWLVILALGFIIFVETLLLWQA
jgi:hypothetical protein